MQLIKNNILIPTYLLLLLMVQTSSAQLATEYYSELSYLELWKEIIAFEGNHFQLSNTKIIVNEGDIGRVNNMLEMQKTIDTRISLSNLKFVNTGWNDLFFMSISDVRFKHKLGLYDLENVFISFTNVDFDHGLVCYNASDWLELEKCSIRTELSINQTSYEDKNPSISIQHSQIIFEENQSNDFDYLIDTSNQFEWDNMAGGLPWNQDKTPKFCSIEQSNKGTLDIQNLGVATDNSNDFVEIAGDFEYIRLDSCSIETKFEISNSHINERLEIKHTNFNQIGFNATTFPLSEHVMCRWQQIGQLAIPITNNHAIMKTYEMDGYININTHPFKSKNFYVGATALEHQDIYTFDELMSLYNKFFHIYRERGDLESANSCYVAMKNVQTSRYKFVYEQKEGLDDWFNWRLNEFLKYFCDYGTSPVKSVIFSLWTILFFAFFYFFFYSSWDKINHQFLIQQHRKLISYFLSKQSLNDFYSDTYKEEFLSYQDYKRDIKKSKKLPFYIWVFGPLLYWRALFKYRMTKAWFERVDILHTDWFSLRNPQKLWIGVKSIISIIAYISFLLGIKALNSIFLSINAFSTLGFGDIPVQGFSRYIAILEGFIGWFLLSIFSVSLISQILQN